MDEEKNREEDQAVEIVDLDEPAERPYPRWLPRWPLTVRQRKITLNSSLVLGVLLLVFLLNSTFNFSSILIHTFVHTTAAKPPSTTFYFYLQGDPDWGAFSIDGRPVEHNPLIGRDNPLSLEAGTHTLVWSAPPFARRSCQLIITNGSVFHSPCFVVGGDVMTSGTSDIDGSIVHNGVPVITIAFFASMSDLTVPLRTSLTQTIQHLFNAYDQSETVYPGEAYAVSQLFNQPGATYCRETVRLAVCIAYATQALKASLHIQLHAGPQNDDPCIEAHQCLQGEDQCWHLCALPNPVNMSQVLSGWDVMALAQLLWSYSTPTGKVVASNQPDSFLLGSSTYHSMILHISWDGRNWRIMPLSGLVGVGNDTIFCQQGSNDTEALIVETTLNKLPPFSYTGSSDNTPDLGIGNCLLSFEIMPGISSGTSPTAVTSPFPTRPFYYLFRFGVALATDAFTHHLLPDLPVADTYELRLMQKLQPFLTTFSVTDSGSEPRRLPR